MKAFEHAEIYFNVCIRFSLRENAVLTLFLQRPIAVRNNNNSSSRSIFQLLCSVDPKLLKLTPFDDQIYETFREDFPNFNVGKVNENEMKNPTAKQKWRTFIEKFNKMDDHSYGTLMRADASHDFGPDNSILVVRVQFWAIEIARNREGFNDKIRYKYKPKPTAANTNTTNPTAQEEEQ